MKFEDWVDCKPKSVVLSRDFVQLADLEQFENFVELEDFVQNVD